jgi:signal transduction histidine kinase
VVNILTNAAKYTDRNGEIRLVSRAEPASAVIEVPDSGVGIAPELLPRVFDLFVQMGSDCVTTQQLATGKNGADWSR